MFFVNHLQADPESFMMGEDENPYTKPMDPINKQHYYKKWRTQPPQPQAPMLVKKNKVLYLEFSITRSFNK